MSFVIYSKLEAPIQMLSNKKDHKDNVRVGKLRMDFVN